MTTTHDFLDPDLAKILSRLASLQGVAIPAHRFGMMATSSGGGDVMEMHRALRAMEWWSSIFPNAFIEELEGQPQRPDLPLLWVKHDGLTTGLVRNVQGNGSVAIEGADGLTETLDSDQQGLGQFIKMRPFIEQSDLKDKPKTAKDWFYFAIKKRIGFFIEAIVATCVVSLLALGVSFYTMQVYDRVVPTQSFQTLIVLTIGTVLAISFEFVMKHVRSRMMDRACKAIDEELSGVFFGRALDIRMDARPRTVGTFAAQIKNFEMVRNFMTSSTLFMMADAPFALFFIFVIFFIGGPVALVPLALLPVSIIIGFYAIWRMGKLADEQNQEGNEKNGLLVEAIDGIESIKAVGGEWKMLERWRTLTSSVASKELDIRATSNLATNLTQTVQQLSYIALIAVGVYEINAGNLTTGALMGCSIISNRALAPISLIAGMIVQWQHAKSSLSALDSIMSLPTDRNSDERLFIPETCHGELKLEEASFSYIEDVKALSPVNLQINPGERVALIGPVGSAKSTLIKVLAGLYKPSTGKVFIDGVDMSHIPSEYLREHIGYLPQDVRLFQGTLRDNLVMGLSSPSDEQILAAAAKTGLDKTIRAHPQGLGLPIYEGGRGLSGGQRQVVGITRLIIAKPKILIVDEPTASMDVELESFIMRNLFASMDQDATIILVTHKLSLLSLTRRLILMDHGSIVGDGPTETVLRNASQSRPGAQPSASILAENAQVKPRALQGDVPA